MARTLGIAILAGRHAPGEVLPGEIEFSEQLGISRTAYREAMRILSAKGLVESKPKTGTRVSDRSRWNLLDPDILAWTFESEPSEAFIRDLFELRQIVEPAAAALAAERRSEADLARMERALDAMARHGLATPEGRAADRAFHHAVLEERRETRRSCPFRVPSRRRSAGRHSTSSACGPCRAIPCRTTASSTRRSAPGTRPWHGEAMSELIRLALADTEMSMTA